MSSKEETLSYCISSKSLERIDKKLKQRLLSHKRATSLSSHIHNSIFCPESFYYTPRLSKLIETQEHLNPLATCIRNRLGREEGPNVNDIYRKVSNKPSFISEVQLGGMADCRRDGRESRMSESNLSSPISPCPYGHIKSAMASPNNLNANYVTTHLDRKMGFRSKSELGGFLVRSNMLFDQGGGNPFLGNTLDWKGRYSNNRSNNSKKNKEQKFYSTISSDRCFHDVNPYSNKIIPNSIKEAFRVVKKNSGSNQKSKKYIRVKDYNIFQGINEGPKNNQNDLLTEMNTILGFTEFRKNKRINNKINNAKIKANLKNLVNKEMYFMSGNQKCDVKKRIHQINLLKASEIAARSRYYSHQEIMEKFNPDNRKPKSNNYGPQKGTNSNRSNKNSAREQEKIEKERYKMERMYPMSVSIAKSASKPFIKLYDRKQMERVAEQLKQKTNKNRPMRLHCEDLLKVMDDDYDQLKAITMNLEVQAENAKKEHNIMNQYKTALRSMSLPKIKQMLDLYPYLLKDSFKKPEVHLHYAAKNTNLDLLKYFLGLNLNPFVKDANNKNLFQIVDQYGSIEMKKYCIRWYNEHYLFN